MQFCQCNKLLICIYLLIIAPNIMLDLCHCDLLFPTEYHSDRTKESDGVTFITSVLTQRWSQWQTQEGHYIVVHLLLPTNAKVTSRAALFAAKNCLQVSSWECMRKRMGNKGWLFVCYYNIDIFRNTLSKWRQHGASCEWHMTMASIGQEHQEMGIWWGDTLLCSLCLGVNLN